jgi:hypothetical protein
MERQGEGGAGDDEGRDAKVEDRIAAMSAARVRRPAAPHPLHRVRRPAAPSNLPLPHFPRYVAATR